MYERRIGRELTLVECLMLLRLDGTLEQAQEGWVFDYNKIDIALNFLGIAHKVKLGFKAGVYKFGHHDSFNDMHEIKVSTYLDIDDANETLWHELAHASQAERLYREKGIPIWKFNKVYNDAMGRKYTTNPFEVEARKVAERYGRMALLS
jgi:hypothetical protein